MSFTVTLGWWVLPAAVTLIAFGWYGAWEDRQPPPSDYGAIGDGLARMLLLALALIASLIAWLIYFIAK